MKIITLQAQGLILTKPSDVQIEQYYHDIVNSNMFDTIVWEGPESVEELKTYWNSGSYTAEDYSKDLNFAIIEKESNRYIGGCSLRPVDGNPNIIDVGIAITPKYHKKGYGTSAMKAMVDYAFSEREAVRIFGKVFVGNFASRKMFEKLNFQYEGTLRSVVLKRGQWLDEWVFSILKKEWDSLKNC